MSRVLIIGDCLIDHYKFYKRVRHDPATVDVPVMKLIKEIKVDGGAGNLVRNLKELIDIEVMFFHRSTPLKIRYYIDDKFIWREDINDEISQEMFNCKKR